LSVYDIVNVLALVHFLRNPWTLLLIQNLILKLLF